MRRESAGTLRSASAKGPQASEQGKQRCGSQVGVGQLGHPDTSDRQFPISYGIKL